MRLRLANLAFLFLSSALLRAEPVRIAVIPGEGDRAPKAGVAELLTAEQVSVEVDDAEICEIEEKPCHASSSPSNCRPRCGGN